MMIEVGGVRRMNVGVINEQGIKPSPIDCRQVYSEVRSSKQVVEFHSGGEW